MRKRPALADALALVDRGQGDVLAVAKPDRLSRSVLDFAQLMVRARDLGWVWWRSISAWTPPRPVGGSSLT